MSRFLWLMAAAALLPAADVQFTLAPKSGRTTFRMGEPVVVELRFHAAVPGKYQIETAPDRRYVRAARLDSFTAEPKEFAPDPLRDIPAQIGDLTGPGYFDAPLDGTVAVESQVNEWVSFRKPGRYRITAESTRVRLVQVPVKLRSNTLEIEIVAPEAGWAEKRAAEAVAVLRRGDGDSDAARQAARTLRFLETSQAARALARFFENGPASAQPELRAGLFGSPHRKEVIAAMERNVAAPDVPVSYYMIATLMELAASGVVPPDPPYPERNPEALKRWYEQQRRRSEQTRPFRDRYMSMLAEAVGTKRGQARAVSLATLFTSGPQPPSPAVIETLLDAFPSLPMGLQHMLLTFEWRRIASPGIEPFLTSVATGSGTGRDFALKRLYELNPEAARGLILGRIRSGDVGDDPRTLMLLPDETLPDMDAPLAAALEEGRPVAPLVARYATAAIFSRVRAWVASQPLAFCQTAILAYFYRVDPAWAASQLGENRQKYPGACIVHLSANQDLLMSPGLERAAIDDLRNPHPSARRSAMNLLENGGSAAAEQPLWDAFARLREEPKGPLDHGFEYGLTQALLKGAGWVLTPDRIDRAPRSLHHRRVPPPGR